MKKTLLFFILGILLAVGTSVFTHAANPKAASKPAKQSIEPVKHSDVCMVQNRYGIMKMIPVPIDGKTYYGCCQGCVARLKFRPEVRFAKDPVTGKDIDKASAFIVGNPDGTVTYFESRDTAEEFFSSRKSL